MPILQTVNKLFIAYTLSPFELESLINKISPTDNAILLPDKFADSLRFSPNYQPLNLH